LERRSFRLGRGPLQRPLRMMTRAQPRAAQHGSRWVDDVDVAASAM
jgi:hypothetical protein